MMSQICLLLAALMMSPVVCRDVDSLTAEMHRPSSYDDNLFNLRRRESSSLVAASSEQPPLVDSLDTLVLNKSQNLSVMCIGAKPVSWTWRNANRVQEGNRVYEMEDNGAEGENSYSKMLYVDNAQWFNTGFYTCTYNNVASVSGAFPMNRRQTENSEDDSSSQIFLFVRDPIELFQETSHQFYFVTDLNQPLMLECGVTDPTIQVELFANGMSRAQEQGVLWDPRSGFKVMLPSYEYATTPLCIANSGIVNQTRELVIYYYPQDNWTPVPYIKPSKYNLFAGEYLTMTCWVKVVQNSLVYMGFMYAKKGKSDRFNESTPTRVNIDRYDNITHSMTVSNVQVSDSGLYTCNTTKDFQLYENSSVDIRVYDKPFVNLTAKSSSVYVRELGHPTMLMVDIFAVPTPVVKWYFEGETIDTTSGLYFEQQMEKYARLVIRLPRTENSGLYTAKATTQIGNTTLTATANITLNVG